MIFSMLRLSYSSRDKGEAVIDENQRRRISFAALTRQVSSYYEYPVKSNGAKLENISQFFIGKPESILFTTTYSGSFGSDAGVVLVEYNITREDDAATVLKVKERLIIDEEVFEAFLLEDDARIDEISKNTLKSEYDILEWDEGFKFRFFSRESATWQNSWDLREEIAAPESVGLFAGDEPIIIIPIHAGQLKQGSI